MTFARTTLGVACLCAIGSALPGRAFAGDDVPAGDDRARAVAAALENENLRMRAHIEAAGILEKAGRHDEAIAALKGVEDVRAEGKSLVDRLLGAPGTVAGRAPTRPPAPPSGPGPEEWTQIARRRPSAAGPEPESSRPPSPAVEALAGALLAARGRDHLWRPASAGDPAEGRADLVTSGFAILALLDASDTRNEIVGDGVGIGPRSDAAFESLTALLALQDPKSGRFGDEADPEAHAISTWALAAGLTRFGDASWRAPLREAVARALADRNAKGLWPSASGTPDDDWTLAAFEVAMLHEARPHADPAGAQAIDVAIERAQRLAFADQIAETPLRTDAGSYARSCLAREARREAAASEVQAVALRVPMVRTEDPRLDATGLLFATALRLGGDPEDLLAWSQQVLRPLENRPLVAGDERSHRHGAPYADACILLSLLAPTSHVRAPRSP